MSRKEWIVAAITVALVSLGLVLWGVVVNWNSSTSLGVAGLYVSVAGFALAITEIRKTSTAAQAAEKAIEATLSAVAAERLLVTLTRLRQSTKEVDLAIGDQHVERARQGLNGWADEAIVCRGLLESRFRRDDETLEALDDTATAAREAKSRLYSLPGDEGWEATAKCLASMEKATDRISPFREQTPTMGAG